MNYVQAVADGNIDLIASDYSPAPPDMKELESGKLGEGYQVRDRVPTLAVVLQLKPGVGLRWVT
jgi:dihydroorotase-like cyclic amidohydrolase